MCFSSTTDLKMFLYWLEYYILNEEMPTIRNRQIGHTVLFITCYNLIGCNYSYCFVVVVIIFVIFITHISVSLHVIIFNVIITVILSLFLLFP